MVLRLIITQMDSYILKSKVTSRNNIGIIGQNVFILKLSLTLSIHTQNVVFYRLNN